LIIDEHYLKIDIMVASLLIPKVSSSYMWYVLLYMSIVYIIMIKKKN